MGKIPWFVVMGPGRHTTMPVDRIGEEFGKPAILRSIRSLLFDRPVPLDDGDLIVMPSGHKLADHEYETVRDLITGSLSPAALPRKARYLVNVYFTQNTGPVGTVEVIAESEEEAKRLATDPQGPYIERALEDAWDTMSNMELSLDAWDDADVAEVIPIEPHETA